jgi:membrane dipeptidase
MKRALLLLSVSLVTACAAPAPRTTLAAPKSHAEMLVLDTHLDTALHLERPGWNFADRHDLADDLAQLDIPRMRDGNLDGGFFTIYTEQGPLTEAGYASALAHARGRSSLIDKMVADNSGVMGFARTAVEARELNAAGKLVALKSIENSYPLGNDLSLLQEFYTKGVRMAGPVHSANNQLADSATDKPLWNGLSPLGREWVREMNRLGMVIDASHASDAAFDQLLELSKYPIILSHSSLRSAHDHPRNLDEVRLKKLAQHGGAMCLSTIFLSDMNLTPARAKLFSQYEHMENMSPQAQADLALAWRKLDQTELMWAADFETYMTMVIRAIAIAGPDHVCFGADWDGGGGIPGLADITALPVVTARLRKAGYSSADIKKMWSGNVLRILSSQRN